MKGTSWARGEGEENEPAESDEELQGRVPDVVRGGGVGNVEVGFKTKRKKHCEETEDFCVGGRVGLPSLQVRGDGKREGK